VHWRRKLPRAGALAGTALVCMAVCAEALAGQPPVPGTNLGTAGGLTYMLHGTNPITAPGFGGGGPACPKGTHVVGGGARIGSSNAVGEADIKASYPSDRQGTDRRPDGAWVALAENGSGAPKALDVMAVCKQGKFHYRRVSHGIRSGTARTLKTSCPGDTHVSGGGVGAFGNQLTGAYLNSSFPYDDADAGSVPDDGWKGRIYNGAGERNGMIAYAICGAKRLHYETVGPLALMGGVPFDSVCPASRHVTGGGVQLGGAPASVTHPVAMTPLDLPADADTTPDDAFRVFAGTTGPGSPTISVQAICK
jgi:hypothetical protein